SPAPTSSPTRWSAALFTNPKARATRRRSRRAWNAGRRCGRGCRRIRHRASTPRAMPLAVGARCSLLCVSWKRKLNLPTVEAAMVDVVRRMSAPWHVWLVGVLSFLWNALFVWQWMLQVTGDPAYWAGMTPAEAAYLRAAPLWTDVAVGIAVWGG